MEYNYKPIKEVMLTSISDFLIRIDPSSKIKDSDLLIADRVMFILNLKKVEELIKHCEKDAKHDVVFIHWYTNKKTFCVGLIVRR